MAEYFSKKKSLGQHFLHAQNYLATVADAANILQGEHVLEVGPGDGALTRVLLARGARVVAIEKDVRLIPRLKETFAKEITLGQLKIEESDALEINFSTLFKRQPYKMVANIPYYITGALLKKIFSEKNPPQSVVLLIQKEVAERIARSQKESILSLSIKAYGNPRYIKTVPKGAFSPPPAVDSAILAVENISRKNFKSMEQEKKFFNVVRAGFAQKRKLLKRNLERVFGKEAESRIKSAGIPLNARAEDVSLEKWLELSK